MVRSGFGLKASDMIRDANKMTGDGAKMRWDWWTSFKKPHSIVRVYQVGQKGVSSFTQSNILSGLRVTGLCPVDRTAIDEGKLELSLLTEMEDDVSFLAMMKMNVLAAPILILLFQQYLFRIQARKNGGFKKQDF